MSDNLELQISLFRAANSDNSFAAACNLHLNEANSDSQLRTLGIDRSTLNS